MDLGQDIPERGGHGQPGHVPVLLKEAIDFLAVKRGGTYLDATVGLGGHSWEIAKRLGAPGHLIGFDKDPAALERSGAVAVADSGSPETGDAAVRRGVADRHFDARVVCGSGRATYLPRPRRHHGRPGSEQFAARTTRSADLVFRQKDRWTCG